MSNVHIIVSANKIDNILKNRYLKFNKIVDISCPYFCYYRYDEKNFSTLDNNQYILSQELYNTIKSYTNQNKLFFATYCLKKHENETTCIHQFMKTITKSTPKQISCIELLSFNKFYLF